MTEFERRRALQLLGERAVDYYTDTGYCVFCDADDCEGIPHEDHCNVGELSGVVVTERRRHEKKQQREEMHRYLEEKSR